MCVYIYIMYIKYLLNIIISKKFKEKHTWNCCGQKAYTGAISTRE